MSSAPLTPPPATPWRRAAPIGIVVAALVSLVVIAFLWPTVTSKAQGIPIAVAGPSAQVAQLEQSVAKAGDALDVRTLPTRADAVREIKQREVYGAIVVSADRAPEFLKATAGSPAVAAMLTTMAGTLQQELGAAGSPAKVTVTDVVPLASGDATGAGLTAAGFPLVLGGMLGGIFLSLLVHGPVRRLLGLVVYAVVGGGAVAGILQGWFGVLQGPYLANAGAFALALSAIAGTVLGAITLLGRRGMVVGPVLFLLFANPLASAATPVEFLPKPWGAIGQAFPPGAGNRLLRDLSYFPDADTTVQWVVLASWTALGVVLIGIAALVHRRQRLAHHGAHVARAPETAGEVLEESLTV